VFSCLNIQITHINSQMYKSSVRLNRRSTETSRHHKQNCRCKMFIFLSVFFNLFCTNMVNINMFDYSTETNTTHKYHLIKEMKSWQEQYCREKHTDLVTVTNMKDMKRLINISAGDQREAWIGLYDQTHGTRTWYWSQPGVEFDESETNWNTNEPNDYGGMQNCGILWNNLKWDDKSCNIPSKFLCYNGENI
uniref:C-type lectin domain-containing protein n=1 Tax=Poecilia latipinna TaxID=48699 RepID=A0A3B3UDU4_9TELE